MISMSKASQLSLISEIADIENMEWRGKGGDETIFLSVWKRLQHIDRDLIAFKLSEQSRNIM